MEAVVLLPLSVGSQVDVAERASFSQSPDMTFTPRTAATSDWLLTGAVLVESMSGETGEKQCV